MSAAKPNPGAALNRHRDCDRTCDPCGKLEGPGHHPRSLFFIPEEGCWPVP